MNVKRKAVKSKKLYCLWRICLIVTISLFSVAGLYAQSTRQVTGSVTDNTGEPLIGASVLEKGTTNGTITNMDGEFSIKVNNENASLEIAYIGYKPVTIPLNGRSSVVIAMEEDSEVLDEVVVVGYGVQKKKLVTGG